MFLEISLLDSARVRPLFEGHKQYLPVLAITNGTFPGRVFVDDIQEPAVAIVWAISRWAYIEAVAEDQDFGRSLAELVRRTIIPDSLIMNINWFELYARNSPFWIGKLDEYLRVFNPTRHFESVYIWDRSSYLRFRSRYSPPEELVIEIAEIPILPRQMCVAPFVSDDLQSRMAIGCEVKAGGEVVALCRSNGFAAGDEFMIDVVTFNEDERGKGLATAAAVGLLDYCLEKGLTPLWETTEDNTASRRLAHKLGFVEDETYPVYAIEF